MPTPIQISLRNMRFHLRVGILPHEGELAQPLEVDLTVWASRPDEGALSVDYRALHALTADVLAQSPLLYLETIAQRLVTGALAQPQVVGARAAVRKPHVALAGPLDCAEVVVSDGYTA
ncbi:MAG: dihydroneopterin aldolase [Gemmatimonadota bacterium]